MYRFRTIHNLLDNHELENQEIYFATPQELNDPMEGYKDVFWKGDKIVWKNFIINYIKSVDHYFSLTVLINDQRIIADGEILAEPHRKIYNTPIHKKLINEIIEKVFENELVKKIPDYLSQRINPIRRAELMSFLNTIHPFVVNSIAEAYFEKNMISKSFLDKNWDKFSFILEKTKHLNELINKQESITLSSVLIDTSEAIFSIFSLMSEQVESLVLHNYTEEEISSNGFFLAYEYPEKYISKLEASIYPDWYSASFLSDCSNSSLWGHYGDGHKGICLKFRIDENNGKKEMNLDTIYGGSSGPHGTIELKDMRPHEFRKIHYSNKHVEIDFFRSLARMNRTQLNAFWYSDEKDNLSSCSDHFRNSDNEDEWRNTYWDNFHKSMCVKLNEWEYEKEYRLLIHGDFVDYSDKKNRKLKYDFNSLEAIIFGINTTTANKLRIIKIIQHKCKKYRRKDFDFYQSFYSKNSGKIEPFKLDLLRFSSEHLV